MDLKLVLICLVCVVRMSCLDVDRLAKRPQGMKHFNMKKFLGTWYVAFGRNPCSWNGANKFTNMYHHYTKDKITGKIIRYDTWRKGKTGKCATIPAGITLTQKPSTYYLQDSIGELYTGSTVVVATDYKSFAITWGCTQMADDGQTCVRYWNSLKTRTPNPSARDLAIAEKIFNKLWGVSILKSLRISHDNPCKMDPQYNVL